MKLPRRHFLHLAAGGRWHGNDDFPNSDLPALQASYH